LAADKAKLDKLDFLPRDREIEQLGHEDWSSEAGFSRLAWQCILTKHWEFLADV
jgi:hypothetical protein